MYHDNELTVVT